MDTTESNKRISNKYVIFSLISLIAVAIITLININETGLYPWGENTYRYIYSTDSSFYFNSLVGLLIIIGGFGFILWGKYFNRPRLCLILGVLWFFIPSNLRVLFSDGNIPIAIINAVIPYLILQYYKVLEESKVKNYIFLLIILMFTTILNSTITITILMLLYIFHIIKAVTRKVDKKGFFVLGIITVGVLVLYFTIGQQLRNWLLPKSIEYLVYPLSNSFNPILRFDNIQVFYIGISFLIVSIFGIVFSKDSYKERVLFWIGLLMFLGTSSALTILYKKLPISEFLVLSRITSLAIAFILLGIVKWKNLNKIVLLAICFMISFDSLMTFETLGFNADIPRNLITKLDIASEATSQKLGILDTSTYGSFPSYYLKYFKELDDEKQLFNSGSLMETDKMRLVSINTALEKNYFTFMFDRCLDMDTDTLLIKKQFVLDSDELEASAQKVGYEKIYEDDDSYIYKYSINGPFTSIATYDGIAIGEYAINITCNFPNMISGQSPYIDEYTIDELKGFKTVFLSGFKYKDKAIAEELLNELSKLGVRVVVDMIGFDSTGFLGITPMTIEQTNNYGQVHYNGEEIKFNDFPQEINRFRSKYIENIRPSEENYVVDKTTVLNYIHYKNDNLIILGMNLPYYLFETKDKNSLKIMEDVLNLKSYTLPKREIIKGGEQ